MKKQFLFVLIVLFLFRPSLVGAQPHEVKSITFPGIYLKWIHVAEAEMHRQHLNLDVYDVFLEERDTVITIWIKSTDAPSDSKGSGGSRPGFEVEILKSDSKIIRANYSR